MPRLHEGLEQLYEKMPNLVDALFAMKGRGAPDWFIAGMPVVRDDLSYTKRQGGCKLHAVDFFCEHGLTFEEALSKAEISEVEREFWWKVFNGSGGPPVEDFISNQEAWQKVYKERYEKCCAALSQLGNGEDFEIEISHIYREANRKILDLVDL